jgi:hypothetical protein
MIQDRHAKKMTISYLKSRNQKCRYQLLMHSAGLNGKVFNYEFIKSSYYLSLLDICDRYHAYRTN